MLTSYGYGGRDVTALFSRLRANRTVVTILSRRLKSVSEYFQEYTTPKMQTLYPCLVPSSLRIVPPPQMETAPLVETIQSKYRT